MLNEFKFTPLDPALESRRRELESLIVEQKKRKEEALIKEVEEKANRMGEVDDVDLNKGGAASSGSSSSSSSSSSAEGNEIVQGGGANDEDGSMEEEEDDDEGKEERTENLLNEFRPQFDEKVDLDYISLELRQGNLATFENLTERSKEVLQPVLEEWSTVCPPDIISKIFLAF